MPKQEHTPFRDKDLDLLKERATTGTYAVVSGLVEELKAARRLLRAADRLLYIADHMWGDGDGEDRGEIGLYLQRCEEPKA